MPDAPMLETCDLILTNQIFRMMVDSARDYAIFTTDTHGRVTTWNAGAQRVLGFREAEILGRHVRLIFTPEDNQHGRPEFEMRQAVRAGQVDDRRWHRHKAGHRFWADGLMMPLRDDCKRHIGFLKIIRDRTAEKHANDARQKAEADLRLMIESATEFAIFTITPEHRVASWNSGAERLFFHRDDEIIGQPARLLFTPEDQALGIPEQEFHLAATTGRADDERWHLRKDDSRFFASGVCTPIRDETGAVVGFTKVCRDITERKRAADAFARQAEESRVQAELLNLSHVFIRDVEGHILYWNQGTADLYGWSKEEAIGQVSHQLLKTRFPVPLAEIEAVIRQEGRWQGELVHTCKDGRVITVSSVWTQHDGEQGRLLLEANTDITKQKELEQSLRHQTQELADADRRKDEFLAMLAHELRNPLAAIHNAACLARMPQAATHLPAALEVIDHQCEILNRLVDDLLDASRIRQGKVRLETQPVELMTILRRAAASVQPLIEQRRHELTLSPAAGPLHVEADPTRLEQLIVNLLTNAAKYTDDGGRITVSAAAEDAQAVIRIRDTGVGIPPEMLPKVFDLFTQVDRSLGRSEGGLGIGLSLVKRLVEMHGGTIAATSEVGQGSEFAVRLPLLGPASRTTAGGG